MKKLSLVLGLLTMSLVGVSEEVVLEQLLGVTVNESGISFQVSSNGCTSENDFNILVEERLEEKGPMLPAFEHHFYLSAVRINPDLCEKYVPYGTVIFKSFAEMGIQFGKFHVNNPIGGDKLVFSNP